MPFSLRSSAGDLERKMCTKCGERQAECKHVRRCDGELRRIASCEMMRKCTRKRTESMTRCFG